MVRRVAVVRRPRRNSLRVAVMRRPPRLRGRPDDREVRMATVETATEIRPFQFDIKDEALEDLGRRIAATRWPSKELVEDRSQGVQLATIQQLAAHWVTYYDLRRVEAGRNGLPPFPI